MAGSAAPIRLPDGPSPRPAETQRFAGMLAVALAVSLVLHAATMMLAASLRGPASVPPGEQAITVEILSPADLLPAVPPSPSMTAPEAAAVPPPPAPPPADSMVHPGAMLAAAALAAPRSAEARRLLRTLDGTERMIQLCGIEAMEQVHAFRPAFDPDRIVAYAARDVEVAGDRVTAHGAAIRSGRAWYALRFDCRVAPDREAVAEFAFRLGAAIPREQWEAQSLADDFADGAPD